MRPTWHATCVVALSGWAAVARRFVFGETTSESFSAIKGEKRLSEVLLMIETCLDVS
jgi:hypothetical protein